jgi:hypothetical protein
MNLNRLLTTAALLLAGQFATPRPALAAETYHTCKGFITTLPTTISTQGVWCLKQDLATAITGGNAIYVGTNNVTIDCNDFKLGGLAAGNASEAYGIYSYDHQNITVRHCNIRGFRVGVGLVGAGHLVEDNRLDNNLWIGIFVDGENSRIRRNAVYDTGGYTGGPEAIGIDGHGNIVDNIVSGLLADVGGGSLTGILAYSEAGRVEGNTISGFNLTATDGNAVPGAIGIETQRTPMTIAGNRIFGPAQNAGYGIKGFSASTNFCLGNTISGFYYGIDNCNSSGNMLAGNTVN